MDWQGIAAVITSIGVIILGYFQYNQHTKNVETEERLRRREEEDRESRKAIKAASQTIYREINRLINSTDALRVYIIQPHPLDRAKFISVQYEVLSEGMTSIVEQVQRMPISNVAGFVAELCSRDFIIWNAQKDVKDGRARAIMHNIGTERMAAMRMMDGEVWLGNIVLDFDGYHHIEAVYLKEKMGEVANIIKYILPEIEE